MTTDEPRWLTLARDHLGLAETPGAKHNPKVVQLFADAGFPGVKDDETSWCSAFAIAMATRAGLDTAGLTLAARSWLKWGEPIERPRPGAIAVFWRGSPNGWQGHVGFYVGETQKSVKVLGGNQSNGVTIANYPKAQLLGYRWPKQPADAPLPMPPQPVSPPPDIDLPSSPSPEPSQPSVGRVVFWIVAGLIAAAAAYFGAQELLP